jgi:2-polyprenyl-3-methyl-5-hydroxy-6-metoxy-1,4-benzoquinol methylase
MPSRILPFDAKPTDYFQNSRGDLVSQLPKPLGRVLDVGCGGGAVGVSLRAQGAQELVGIEYDSEAAERARAVFDDVVTGDAEKAVADLDGSFDTICCYDILEHLYDPAALVEALLTLAKPGSRLHVSIPNVRHFSLFRDLLVRGTFGYEQVGHRDVTHLRWFTRRDIETMLTDCGWELVQSGSNAMKPGRQALSMATRGYAREFFAVQWYVLCKAPG